MVAAPDFDQIAPGILVWQAYDQASKTDLFSTAIPGKTGIFLVDPIELEEAALARLTASEPLAGLILTNANHLRGVETYALQFSVPIFSHPDVAPHLPAIRVSKVNDGARIGESLEVISLEGAGCGEIALYDPSGGGTLVIGDALIHFNPYGFAPLPDKYSENPKQMHRSLKKLAAYKVERIFFAHGVPILTRAQARLRALLDVDLEKP